MTQEPVVGEVTATPDPPPTGIRNPIHDADGADSAGYSGALVAGVRTYGWAAQTIVRALGAAWLDSGWADITLRRPLYAGERVTITVSRSPDEGGGARLLTCVASGEGEARTVLDGTVGLGEAPWLSELDPPEPAAGQDPPEVRPTYDLSSIPIGAPLRPLTAYVKSDTARSFATDDLGLTDPDDLAPYVDEALPTIHPYFLAGRMAPLTRHNFTYGPTIHVRTQIQHRARAMAEQPITVGATIVDAYDRNEHWYQVLDGIISGGPISGGPISGGPAETATTLAVLRHHTIFRPRGTTMPKPG